MLAVLSFLTQYLLDTLAPVDRNTAEQVTACFTAEQQLKTLSVDPDDAPGVSLPRRNALGCVLRKMERLMHWWKWVPPFHQTARRRSRGGSKTSAEEELGDDSFHGRVSIERRALLIPSRGLPRNREGRAASPGSLERNTPNLRYREAHMCDLWSERCTWKAQTGRFGNIGISTEVMSRAGRAATLSMETGTETPPLCLGELSDPPLGRNIERATMLIWATRTLVRTWTLATKR